MLTNAPVLGSRTQPPASPSQSCPCSTTHQRLLSLSLSLPLPSLLLAIRGSCGQAFESTLAHAGEAVLGEQHPEPAQPEDGQAGCPRSGTWEATWELHLKFKAGKGYAGALPGLQRDLPGKLPPQTPSLPDAQACLPTLLQHACLHGCWVAGRSPASAHAQRTPGYLQQACLRHLPQPCLDCSAASYYKKDVVCSNACLTSQLQPTADHILSKSCG